MDLDLSLARGFAVQAHAGPDVAALVQDLTDLSRPEDGNRAQRKAIDLCNTRHRPARVRSPSSALT